MRFIARVCTTASLAALIAHQGIAQSAPAAFEVVSIKPRVGESTIGPARPAAPDRYDDPDTTLHFLIRWAYDLFDFELVGGPGWLDVKRWEISAKAPAPVARGAMRPLVRRMLADRFALKAHMETRELPIYELVLARSDARLGPKIKRAAVDCTPFLNGLRPMQESPRDSDDLPLCSAGASFSSSLLTPRLNGQPLAAGLITFLQANLQRRVVDKTGLTGNYDIELSYIDETLFRKGVGTEDGPSLRTALQEQLGMRLESARGPVEVLVIDSVSEPTTN